jgi:hypothetical protein
VFGTVMPSALAVFRLMTNSNLVACMTGNSAGFSALKNPAVAHQTASRRKGTILTDRIEFESFHFCSMASNLARGVDRDLGCLVFPIHHHNRHG